MPYTSEEIREMLSAQASSPWLSEQWRTIEITKDITVLLKSLRQTIKLQHEAQRRFPLLWIVNRITAVIWMAVITASVISPVALLAGHDGLFYWIGLTVGYGLMMVIFYAITTHPQIKEVEERFRAREDSAYNSAISFRLLKRMIEIRIEELRRASQKS